MEPSWEIEDYQQKTIDWLASMPDELPSERLEFIKRIMCLCTTDELKRLKVMTRTMRKRIPKDETKRQSVVNETKPWWTEYGEETIVDIDLEMVIKNGTMCPASVDIVNIQGKPIYSTLVHHDPGTFSDSLPWRTLTGFNRNSFADKKLPNEQETRDRVCEILKDKLVITIGGESDFRALKLDMAYFDVFDLQSHFYIHKVDEHGITVREPHSLRSLSSHFLNKTQGLAHNSLSDATMTMELFHIYKVCKMQDDVAHCAHRYNASFPYNNIPVLPNPMKERFPKRKKRSHNAS